MGTKILEIECLISSTWLVQWRDSKKQVQFNDWSFRSSTRWWSTVWWLWVSQSSWGMCSHSHFVFSCLNLIGLGKLHWTILCDDYASWSFASYWNPSDMVSNLMFLYFSCIPEKTCKGSSYSGDTGEECCSWKESERTPSSKGHQEPWGFVLQSHV